jgi:hypothetical protein
MLAPQRLGQLALADRIPRCTASTASRQRSLAAPSRTGPAVPITSTGPWIRNVDPPVPMPTSVGAFRTDRLPLRHRSKLLSSWNHFGITG